MFQKKDPLLKPLDEHCSTEEARKVVELLQAKLIKATEKLKAENGKVNAQRKDSEAKERVLFYRKIRVAELEYSIKSIKQSSAYKALKYFYSIKRRVKSFFKIKAA